MNPITNQISNLEKAYSERHEKPLHFEAELLELKLLLRKYCKEKGYYNRTGEGR